MEKRSTNVTICFGSNMTVRWSCQQGDTLVWFRCKDIFDDPERGVDIRDMWEIRPGDSVTITNRVDDLPLWFSLHPTEVCNNVAHKIAEKLRGYQPRVIMEGMNMWRLRAGDTMAWIGEPRTGIQSHGSVLAVLDFLKCGIALGASNPHTLIKDFMSFGSPLPRGEDGRCVAKLREAVSVIRKMGPPRTLDGDRDWRLG